MSDKTKWEEIKEYYRDWKYNNWNWRWRNLENIVDDPIDDVKHKIHGAKIFGYVIRLPKWLMPGSGDDTK
jgi:hypothetical protein